MHFEYQILAAFTLFFTLAWLPASVGKFGAFGVKWLASNRQDAPTGVLRPWAQRCERAYNNLKDYFPAFAVAILTLGAMGKFDEGTKCAALIFVAARLVHYISYGFGIFLPRFLSFQAGLLANIYLLVKIFI